VLLLEEKAEFVACSLLICQVSSVALSLSPSGTDFSSLSRERECRVCTLYFTLLTVQLERGGERESSLCTTVLLAPVRYSIERAEGALKALLTDVLNG
jgi:hypothetical protein